MVQKVAIPLHSLLRNSDAMAAATAMIEKRKKFFAYLASAVTRSSHQNIPLFYIIYCLGHLSHCGIGFNNTL